MACHRLSRLPCLLQLLQRHGVELAHQLLQRQFGLGDVLRLGLLGGLVRGLRLAGFVALALLQNLHGSGLRSQHAGQGLRALRQLPMAARAVSILSARALAFAARRAGCCRGWQTAAHRRAPGPGGVRSLCRQGLQLLRKLGDLLLALGQLGLGLAQVLIDAAVLLERSAPGAHGRYRQALAHRVFGVGRPAQGAGQLFVRAAGGRGLLACAWRCRCHCAPEPAAGVR